jgi:hypothetical protein
MEDFTLPSVGGSFKKWVHSAPILPKPPGPFPKLPKNKILQKKIQKIKTDCIESGIARQPRTGAQAFSLCNLFLIPPTLLFLRMWSTLSAHARPAYSSPKNFKHP